MLKYPIFLQDNENSCGAYCIKMLLSFYKRDDEIKNIKKRCRLTKEGITVYGLIQVLKKYHLEAKAYQCEFKHLFEEVNCPAIVHLKQDDLYHYVILYKVKDGYFLVGDPAKGLIKMSYESFSKQFTGIIIMIDHVGMPITKRTNYTFQNFLICFPVYLWLNRHSCSCKNNGNAYNILSSILSLFDNDERTLHL